MGMTTEQQVFYDAGVKAERERAAKVAEGWLETFGATNPEYVSAHTWANGAVRDIADQIRNPS